MCSARIPRTVGLRKRSPIIQGSCGTRLHPLRGCCTQTGPRTLCMFSEIVSDRLVLVLCAAHLRIFPVMRMPGRRAHARLFFLHKPGTGSVCYTAPGNFSGTQRVGRALVDFATIFPRFLASPGCRTVPGNPAGIRRIGQALVGPDHARPPGAVPLRVSYLHLPRLFSEDGAEHIRRPALAGADFPVSGVAVHSEHPECFLLLHRLQVILDEILLVLRFAGGRIL